MEHLRIEQVYPAKTKQDGTQYYPATCNHKTYNFDQPVKVGDEVDVDVRESSYTNRQGQPAVSRWATIKQQAKPSSQTAECQNGRRGLNQFEFAEALDFYWDKLKAWEMKDEAKASVLCTCLIATADGRVAFEFPPEEEGPFED